MDYIKTEQGLKLIGQGEATVIEVSQESADNHKVRVRHPDIGDTQFIPYVQTAGMYKVPKVGDTCYVFMRENFSNYPIAWGHKLTESAVSALLGARKNDITVVYTTDSEGLAHKIELDSGEDSGIRVTTKGGNKITVQNDADITITQVAGAEVAVKEAEISLKIGTSEIVMTEESITIKAGGSEMVMDKSVNIKASDDMATVDKVIISTHDHILGNVGYPTSGGPTRLGE